MPIACSAVPRSIRNPAVATRSQGARRLCDGAKGRPIAPHEDTNESDKPVVQVKSTPPSATARRFNGQRSPRQPREKLRLGAQSQPEIEDRGTTANGSGPGSISRSGGPRCSQGHGWAPVLLIVLTRAKGATVVVISRPRNWRRNEAGLKPTAVGTDGTKFVSLSREQAVSLDARPHARLPSPLPGVVEQKGVHEHARFDTCPGKLNSRLARSRL
jgi:hypothetical protein